MSAQNLPISVCIPTYKRLDLLTEAINSCLAQTRLPQEILIGDNSPDTETEELVKSISKDTSVEIRYFHNVPSLTQAGNVDHLFGQVRCELLLLLHDDDTLVPDCLENLHACFVAHPEVDVALGKQYLMSNEGVVDYARSEALNKTFYRGPEYAGMKLSPLEAAILQQFPNDCYMIRSAVAQKVGYSGKTMHACDFEFGLKLGLGNHNIYFVDKYTAYYRLSANALSNNLDNDGGLVIYQLVEALDVPQESIKYKAKILKEKAPVAIAQAANLKQPQKALKIYLSEWHRSKILTKTGVKGLYHVVRAFL